jgi:hypothetical protein
LTHRAGTIPVERSGTRPEAAADRVLATLLVSPEPLSPEAIAERTGVNVGTVKNKLTELKKAGKADRARHGYWLAARASSSSSQPPSNSDNDDFVAAPAVAVADQIAESLAVGELLGWRDLPYAPGLAIAAGQANWRRSHNSRRPRS